MVAGGREIFTLYGWRSVSMDVMVSGKERVAYDDELYRMQEPRRGISRHPCAVAEVLGV